jgi:hypothetical protein
VIDTNFIDRTIAVVYDSCGLAHIAGRSAVIFVKQFSERSVMSDKRRGRTPTPILRTRAATMLTAIGLCLFIMVVQFMPEIRGLGSRMPTNSDVVNRMPMSPNNTMPASAITR